MGATIKTLRRIFRIQAREMKVPPQEIPGVWRAIKRKFASLPESERAKALAQFREIAAVELARSRTRATVKRGKADAIPPSESPPPGQP